MLYISLLNPLYLHMRGMLYNIYIYYFNYFLKLFFFNLNIFAIVYISIKNILHFFR